MIQEDFSQQTAQHPQTFCQRVPSQGHQRTEELRLTAEKAFLDWNSADRMTRALNSRHRRVLDFSAGDLVFIWRRQVTGKDARPSNDTQGRFVGPARILATEQHKDIQGHLVPGSSVWLVRGRRLLKCCPRTVEACVREGTAHRRPPCR